MMLMRFFSVTAAAQVPGATIALAGLLALALAALIGVINGLLIARIRLSPFVTTLTPRLLGDQARQAAEQHGKDRLVWSA
jgi:ribose/xylose/arabinose/galactoside ABC-type transport system permease subunit